MFKILASTVALLCGAAFAAPFAPAHAGTYKLLYSFTGGSDGAHPGGSLIDVHGILYGTAAAGGTVNSDCPTGCGTVYAMNPGTGAVTGVHAFDFSDGSDPTSLLQVVGATLYGTTYYGGPGGSANGTVFSMDSKTGSIITAYTFSGGSDGGNPNGVQIHAGDSLYGVTNYGGSADAGTVFSLNLPNGPETVLHSFGSSSGDGSRPESILDGNAGILYGTTREGGGRHGAGTLFAVNPDTGDEHVLYTFRPNDLGAHPNGGLIRVGGKLYGTTFGNKAGCRPDCGTVFSRKSRSGVMKLVYAFPGGKAGENPSTGLTRVGGILYGATRNGGGKCRCGNLYSVDPKTGTETAVYSFQGSNDGANPESGLLNVGGTLYGTTTNGGTDGFGTIYSYTP
jgi:uncharacterized repeat protein (TIGR03803 family)